MSVALWQPDTDRLRDSNLENFVSDLRKHTDFAISDYDKLYEYSLDNPEDFWSEIWRQCGVVGDLGARPYLEDANKMPGARFFPRARLNFTENLLRRSDDGDAIVFRGEDKVARRYSWKELCDAVSSAQQALRASGLTAGDRVAAIVPNTPETIIAMLAATSLGAIWSSCSPDFGVQGALDRFSQIEPKILFGCDGYHYGGKYFEISGKIIGIAHELPTLTDIVVLPYGTEDSGFALKVRSGLGDAGHDGGLNPERVVGWQAFLAPFEPRRPEFERFAFDHPLYILFSSGTTGIPKCIVHSVGGTLLQHLKEQRLHCDIKPADRVFYFTTCGWMMWNWLVSALASEATLLLYDGNPFYPSGNVLFDLAQDERMTFFGASAKYIDALKKAGLRPRDTHDLDSVRAIASTGSPLVPESFDYVYDAIRSDVHLASISGGTDIVSCFVLGNPVKPVYRGEIQGPGLGMAVDVFDDEGRSLKSGKGELVCTKPFPSMPIGFWNDATGDKYLNAYFRRFDNTWHHGDFAEWTEHGGIVIHGRSDATLNPGGVRIGTAEIYRQVEQLPEIQEALVIGQDWDGDTRVILFIVPKPGHTIDADVEKRIRQRIREGASPRHVPAKIICVPDIPRTKSGKITELAVRDIIHGKEVKNKEALANPDALEFFRDRPELAE